MQLPDCAFDVDVKNVLVCPSRIILQRVMTRQRGEDIKKHSVLINCVVKRYFQKWFEIKFSQDE